MTTPRMQKPIPISSDFVISSPRNKKAIMVAKIGEVLLMKESLDKDINCTATLKMKNVIVPVIALIITNLHMSSGTSSKFTLSLTAIKYETAN